MKLKKITKALLLLLVLLFASFVAFSLYNEKNNSLSVSHLNFADKKFSVILADSPIERSRGLSGRDALSHDQAMLFVFPEEGEHPFWMKDMNFSIDIFWFNDEKELIFMKQNAQAKDFPKSYGHGYNARFVLETVSGFADQKNIQLGEKMHFLE